MQTKEGVFIVIEGTDGSGKSTQFELLTKRLENAGYDVATFKFPQYNEPSSYFVKQYLAGAYGAVDEVGPYTASLFYALDRFGAAAKIREALAQGKIVVVDRYTGSNMAHQGTKFHHAEQRRGYFIWLDNLEFEMLKIPRPDINFVLNVPAEVTQDLLKKTEKKRDIHEIDIEHLKRSVEVFNDLSQLFPKDFIRIDCVRSGEMLSIDIINNLIWEKIQPLLPTAPERKRTALAEVTKSETTTEVEDNPYIQKTRTGTRVTRAGREFLEKVVTDTSGDIYAFKDKFNATMIAAAINRSSHRTESLRTVILDAFAKSYENNDRVRQALLGEINPSMKKLVGLHAVAEQQSMLASTILEQSRHTSYVMPEVDLAQYDDKDEHGQYKYYTPENLKGQAAQDYRQRMDEIFDNYATIVNHLTRYLRERTSMPRDEQTATWERATHAQARQIAIAVLPVAAKTSVNLFTSAKTLEQTIKWLLKSPLMEVKTTGQKLLEQAQNVAPGIFEHIDTEQKAFDHSAVQQFTDEYLPDKYAASFEEPVSLSDYWPRNELDLAADMLYEYSNLPHIELKREIDKWPYDRKAEALTTYLHANHNLQHRQGMAIEKAHYSWDIVCDFTVFRDMLHYQSVENLNWQQLTPRNGYEMPTIIEDAGMADLFEACFDVSLDLHSKLQEAGYPIEAQYATLMGHRMRWTATYNARDAYRMIRTHAQNPESGKLLSQMYALLTEVHPVIADALRDIDK